MNQYVVIPLFHRFGGSNSQPVLVDVLVSAEVSRDQHHLEAETECEDKQELEADPPAGVGAIGLHAIND